MPIRCPLAAPYSEPGSRVRWVLAAVTFWLMALHGNPASAFGFDDVAAREAVQTTTLLALRALGVVDARARGVVAQCVLPEADKKV